MPTPTTRGHAGSIAVTVSWLVVAGVTLAVPVSQGVPVWDAVRYVGTWLVSTTVPGVLVWRAFARPSSLVEELGFGNVLGVALLLLAWVPAVLVGEAWLAWWWPLVVLLVFSCVPSLRGYWWPSRGERSHTPSRWHVATAGVCVVALGYQLVNVLRFRVMPGTGPLRVHPDLWFQQTLVNELQHTLDLMQPQVAGVPKRYHWFSNADVAVTSQMSGMPATTVLFYLWITVLTVTMVLAAAALARRLLDDSDEPVYWWVGPLAALLVAAIPVVLLLGEPRLRNLTNGFIPVSTSGMLGLVVVLGLSGPAIDLVRGRGPRRGWVLMLLMMALAVGTKPSNLPIATCAFLLVAFVRFVRTRTVFWTPVVLAVVAVAMIGGSTFKLMGGEAGTGVVPLETLGLDTAMKVAHDSGDAGRVVAVGAGLFVLYVVTQLPRLLGMLGVLHRRTRFDPAIWWSAGVVFAGWCASWLVSQPGYSQQYFWRVVIVQAVVTSVVVAVRIVPPQVRYHGPWRPLLTVIVAGLVVGYGVLLWWPEVDTSDPDTGAFTRLVPYAVALLVAVAAVGIARLRRLRGPVGPVPVLTLVIAFVFAAGTPAAADDLREPIRLAAQGAPVPYTSREAPRLVTAKEQQAGLWLRDHAGENGGGNVVTNVMCVPTEYKDRCQSTAYWVGALSGLPVVMGGWAYTEKGRAVYAEHPDAPSYKYRRSPYPERKRLSLTMIRNPSARVATRLHDEYGARWIFADRRATRVSPDITRFADLRYQNSDVLVLELH